MSPRTDKRFRELEDRLRHARTGKLLDSKIVENNTRLVRVDADTIALRHHCTDVCTLYRNGTIEVDPKGWHSVTTLQRVNAFLRENTGAGGYYSDGMFQVWSKRRQENGVRFSELHLWRYDASAPWSRRYATRAYRFADGTVSDRCARRLIGPSQWPYSEYSEYGREFRTGWAVETGTGKWIDRGRFYDGTTISRRGKVTLPKPKRYRAPANPRRPLRAMYERERGALYKVVSAGMTAPYVPSYRWTIGKWHTIPGKLEPCKNALHCATRGQIAQWLTADCRVFRAETRGPAWSALGKTFARTIRLTDEVDRGTVFALARLEIPADGIALGVDGSFRVVTMAGTVRAERIRQ